MQKRFLKQLRWEGNGQPASEQSQFGSASKYFELLARNYETKYKKENVHWAKARPGEKLAVREKKNKNKTSEKSGAGKKTA